MTPLPAAAAPGWRQIARGLYRNALDIFPPEAFEEAFVRRHVLGREQIILCDPDAIRHILVEHPENYRRTAATVRILRPVLGGGLLLAEGEEWRCQRRILAPAFAPRTLPLVARHAGFAAERAAARLAAAARPVDLLAELQLLTLEVAGRAMFSLETERFAAPMRRLLLDYGADLGRPSPLDIMLPLWLPSPRDLRRRRFRRRWRALLDEIIVERRRRGAAAAPGDLFDLIAAARDPESGAGFSARGLADEVATLIVAGHETTALALFWSLYLLCEAPAAMARLHAEAAPLDLAPERAAESLPRLVYARAVVEEALRLYPPAFAIARQARAADRAGGIAIPARAVILIAPWVLHRHRRSWEEPERFEPARFLPPAPRPDRFRYLPFGVGPRTCIGAQFALVEASLVLARLVQAFAIERIGEERVRPVGVVTTRPDPLPLFRLRPRGGLRIDAGRTLPRRYAMKQTIFAATAVAAIALGATFAAAQSDETNKKPSAAATEQQTAPKTSTKAQSEQTRPRREPRSAAEEKGREGGAAAQAQKEEAGHPSGTAQTQTPTQPKREENATGKREPTVQGAVPQPQKPASAAQTQTRPNREERTPAESAQTRHGNLSQTQSNREMGTSTDRGRTEPGGLSATRPGAAAGEPGVISDRDRRRLQERFAAAPPHRVARFGFRVSVGAAVPRRVRLYPLPASVAAVVPQFRGYRYVADSDRIVIVEPGTFRIVEVLPYGEGFMGAGTAPGVFRPLAFSERRRAEIRERIHTVSLRPPAHATLRFAIGAFVPPSVRLYAMPPAVAAVAPELRFYRYVIARGRFVVVDPRVLRIVAIFPV